MTEDLQKRVNNTGAVFSLCYEGMKRDVFGGGFDNPTGSLILSLPRINGQEGFRYVMDVIRFQIVYSRKHTLELVIWKSKSSSIDELGTMENTRNTINNLLNDDPHVAMALSIANGHVKDRMEVTKKKKKDTSNKGNLWYPAWMDEIVP